MNTLFADVLQELHEDRKTGALFVTVVQSTQYLVRFWFENGEIRRLSYGPLRGGECMELLDCYDFGNAIFYDGMKTPFGADRQIPRTPGFISDLRKTGKTIGALQVTLVAARRNSLVPAAA
jgi:hypothetical protein